MAVVIPTRDREDHLQTALTALGKQTLPKSAFEVIVVRDSLQREERAIPPPDLSVRFLKLPGDHGPTAKRNRGWRASTARQVAFTDDDCRPAPDWLERLMSEFAETVFLQGRTEADPEQLHLLRGFARTRTVLAPDPWFPCCNTAFPRSLLERLGGFDESYYFGGEDTDLALRALEIGAQWRFVDDAVVWHAILQRSFEDALREARAWPSFPLLVSRHPKQRRHLYRSAFRNKSHATLLLALAGAAAARGCPVLALAAVPYLSHKVRPQLLGGVGDVATVARVLARLPAWTLIDCMEVAATVRSAAAHRVLVA